MVALLVDSTYVSDIERMADDIKAYVLDLRSRGAVGVLVIVSSYTDGTRLGNLSPSVCTIADIIPIMFIMNSDAGTLEHPGAKLTAYPGYLLPRCRAICLYLPGSCALSRGVLCLTLLLCLC